ncbi:SDR family NAD(P)-dependent oxidoreductase [Mycobacterium spongiae]|uniref:SDR family NAD(P)-dependent oxidoreductase n=2 Tax=Mycobacterium spongiae TaxID=886343 RepID=A0A975PWC5_9MYCO|nr:SDR family NAD(P)-dependent oxidoreductase [Mycobacterium spongiae]
MRTAFSRVAGMNADQRAAVDDAFSQASRTAAAEPVAVVGMGCRFPGDVTGPDSFWKLLVDGRNAVSRVPADRWDADALYDPDPLTPGRMTTKWGGFVPDIAGFDADFFGITPREATAMDPQQRMLLEVAWEALENAGIPTDSLAGTRTGVMMGVYFNEYQSMVATGPERVDAYTGTGNAHSITAGRISYLLGLRGPAMAVDTACSSSLAAVHLACQSLRLRESDVALAGGVSLILRPETQIAISAWGLLSPHGRCATFDAAADGFVRGEGAGVVVLKRLTDAVRDGDQVLAVVRGSAINQDGRSNGITAPNTEAQCGVITDALRFGDVAPDSVDYVEAHGTGTALGDPIEFEALAATYGRGDGECALGAVKTNLGHLEAAAGIAGFIKAVLALQHRQIPPNLHFSQWNPAIDASSTRFFVPTDNVAWPSTSSPRRAAVSSFGLGGTNAHVVIEQGPDATPVAADAPAPAVSTLVVPGKTAQRVGTTASVLAEWMAGPGAEVALADVAHTLNHHRARQATFATVVARDHTQAVTGLRALAAGQSADGVVGCQAGPAAPGTVFVYSGRGWRWAGMGRHLLADEPAFAAAIAELEPDFLAQAGFSLHDVIAQGKELVGIEQIQLGLIGMQLALTALWRSYGVTPDAVIGHSMGEVTAAVVAGALTPAEGLRITATRSRLMAPLSGQGGMALLELDAEQTEALIADHPDVTLAIYNSPRQTVIAGPTQQIEALIETVRAQNQFASRVNIEVAPHNQAMDALQPPMRSELADLRPKSPTIPIISTTYEDLDRTPVFDAEHWATNMRNPVRFQQAITAAGAEHHTFIEISAHPLLTHAVTDILGSAAHRSIGTLQRDADDTITFHTNLNTTHTTHPPQTPHPPGPHPRIPTTPWHHTHHWFTDTAPEHHTTHTQPVSQVEDSDDEVAMAVLQSPGGAGEGAGRLFTLEWEPAALGKPAGSVGDLLVVGEPADGLVAGLVGGVGDQVGRCEVVGADDQQRLQQVISESDRGFDAVMVVCPPRAVDEALPQQAQLDLAQQRTLFIAELVKTISRVGARNSPRLWIVTRGAAQLDAGEHVTLSSAQLRGIARVLAFEHPELKTTMVDVEADGEDSVAALTEELLAGSDDDEVALRAGHRWVNRLVPAPTTAGGELVVESRTTVADLDAGAAVRLQIDQPGRLDALTVHAVKRIAPQPGQVEVRIAAAGLNFADVLKAMGIYPGTDGPPVIGGECVGVVTAVGADVDSVAIGQRVIAFGPGTFGSHMTTLADLVVPISDELADGQAAAFGIAYLTAWESLCVVGRLAPGERVLIHSATGGVGLAAISIAKMIGARIYTTAGSDDKRAMLAELGVDYIGDSRSVDFADEILETTEGYGVDLILNSLPGEAIQRGVRILAPGGRFVEIGKKDVHADANLGLAALAKSASFTVVDLDLNLRLQPARYRRLLHEILQHVSDGTLQAPPVTEFSLDHAFDAFRLMASGKHTGKIVISIPATGRIDAAASPPPLVTSDGGYIVVGGMGGLGLVVAEWLANHGAGLIVLNGRCAPNDDASATIAELTAAGHRIEVITGDITDADTATRLVTAVEDAGFRVAGVVHSAMVLADEIVLNMSESAATTVFTPKVTGNWRLHEATTHLDLDWWLTFSSVASLIGSPGQGAYAAANSWVDALVSHRRSHGLPAIGINWGPWAEVGRAQFLADLGVTMLTTEQGLSALQAVLTADRAHTGVFTLDARQYFQSFPALAASSLFATLRDTTTNGDWGAWVPTPITPPESAFRKSLRTCQPERRRNLLFDHVNALATTVMALPPTKPLDPWTGFFQLGMDSLMSLALARALSESLGEFLPPSAVFDYPTVDALTDYLAGILPELVEAEDQPADNGYDELTEDECLQQLLERLK